MKLVWTPLEDGSGSTAQIGNAIRLLVSREERAWFFIVETTWTHHRKRGFALLRDAQVCAEGLAHAIIQDMLDRRI